MTSVCVHWGNLQLNFFVQQKNTKHKTSPQDLDSAFDKIQTSQYLSSFCNVGLSLLILIITKVKFV